MLGLVKNVSEIIPSSAPPQPAQTAFDAPLPPFAVSKPEILLPTPAPCDEVGLGAAAYSITAARGAANVINRCDERVVVTMTPVRAGSDTTAAPAASLYKIALAKGELSQVAFSVPEWSHPPGLPTFNDLCGQGWLVRFDVWQLPFGEVPQTPIHPPAPWNMVWVDGAVVACS